MELKPEKEQFKCSLGRKKFKSESSLAIHDKMYRLKNVYRSAYQFQGRSRPGLKLLKVLRHHVTDKTHKCDICMKSFDSRSNLIRHAVLFSHSQSSDDTGLMPSSVNLMEKADSESEKEESSDTKFHLSNDDLGFEEVSRHVRLGSSEQPFECVICRKSFRFKCDVIRHVRGHTGEKPYFCSFCDKTFNYGGNLNKHILRRHKDQDLSGLVTRRRAAKNKQRKINISHKRHLQRKRKTLKTLQKISKEKSDEKVGKTQLLAKCFECGLCGKVCQEKMDMVKHIKVHVKKRSHACPICQKEFKSAYICEKHKRKTHSDEDSSVRRSLRRNKGGNRKKFQDFVLFDEDSDLERKGGKLKDSVNGKEDVCYIMHGETPAGKQVFECSACNKQFSSLAFIKRHLKIHIGENMNSISEKSSNDKDDRPMDMSNFERSSSGSDGDWEELGDQRKKGLKNENTEPFFLPQSTRGRLGNLLNKQRMLKRSNIRKAGNVLSPYDMDLVEAEGSSSNNVADKFEEADCSEPFSDDSNRYRCIECDQYFNFVSNFYKHMERRHGNRPFPRQRQLVKSSICNKTIILESRTYEDLSRKGEKFYRCSECGYESNNSGNLYKHMRRIHKGCTIEKKVVNDFEDGAEERSKVVKCSAWETKTGEKVFLCSACGYRSNFSSNVYKHLRRKHKDCLIEEPRKSPVKASSNSFYSKDEGHELGKKILPVSPLAPSKEVHKILVNNKSVSVLMNQDSLLKRKTVENTDRFEERVKKKKVETSLWSLEDSVFKRQLPEEVEIPIQTVQSDLQTVHSALQTIQTVPMFVNQEDTLRVGEAESNAISDVSTNTQQEDETVTLVIRPDGEHTFNEDSVVTILINAEDIVEGDVNAGNGQAVTILLNPEDSLEQKAAESLLDLAIKEDTSNFINVLKGPE